MSDQRIVHTQERVGTVPDGFWGPKSTRAAETYLRGMMPDPHPFPTRDSVSEFYGPHGVKDGRTPDLDGLRPAYPLYLYGDQEKKIQGDIWAHELVADSLERVFERLLEVYPGAYEREQAGVDSFYGIYNPRRIRGSSTAWSMHAWAVAIDLDAENNGFRDHWPLQATMPIEVMECFALEGWTAAGAFWSRDAMHFEAIKPY